MVGFFPLRRHSDANRAPRFEDWCVISNTAIPCNQYTDLKVGCSSCLLNIFAEAPSPPKKSSHREDALLSVRNAELRQTRECSIHARTHLPTPKEHLEFSTCVREKINIWNSQILQQVANLGRRLTFDILIAVCTPENRVLTLKFEPCRYLLKRPLAVSKSIVSPSRRSSRDGYDLILLPRLIVQVSSAHMLQDGTNLGEKETSCTFNRLTRLDSWKGMPGREAHASAKSTVRRRYGKTLTMLCLGMVDLAAEFGLVPLIADTAVQYVPIFNESLSLVLFSLFLNISHQDSPSRE